MANLDSEWEFTWLSQVIVSLQLDDNGSTGMTIHRRTREKKTICMQVKKVSSANSASLPPRRITNGFTVQASVVHLLSLKGLRTEQVDVGSNPAQGIKEFFSQ